MTNIGPGFVYAMYTVAGTPLVLVITMAAYYLKQHYDVAAWQTTVYPAAAVTAVMSVVITVASGRSPVFGTALATALFGVPAVLAAFIAGDRPETAWPVAAVGWLVVHVTGVALAFAGVSFLPLIEGTPGLFRIEWFAGYVAYTALVGIIGGLLGRILADVEGNE